MKKIIAALLALASAAALSATLTPIQLLNPTGSTSGQAVVSTGASSAPAWGNPIAAYAAQAANTVLANVTASSASPTAVAIPNCSTTTSALQYTSGTGFGCGTGFAPLSSPSFTAPMTLTDTTGNLAGFTLNGSGSSSGASIKLLGNGSTTPSKYLRVLSGTLQVVNDGFSSVLFSLTDAGALTSTSIANTPISGSSGSFTTLAASSTVSGTGFSNYLASPPTIGGTTPGAVNANGGTLNAVTIGTTSAGAAQFSQLVMTGLLTPQSTTGIKGTTTNDSPAAGSVGENPTNATTSVSMTSSSATNCTSQSLTAGNWMVGGVVTFLPSAAPSQLVAGVSTTSATLGSTGSFQSLVTSFTSASNQAIAAPVQFLKLPSTTTVYLIGQATFGSGTTTCYGNIYALRIR